MPSHDATPESIRTRVEELAEMVRTNEGDNEEWHLNEDQILVDALSAIADGAANPRAIAAEALRTEDIEYDHWYA